MSIDTRQKRFSMMNFGSGIHLRVMFEADGSVDADDRMHLLDMYSGFVSTGAARRLKGNYRRKRPRAQKR